MSETDDLHAIIADQSETIDQLRAELTEEQRDPYYEGVYDRIRAAWDRWALAELGTSSPSPLDLQGRPELAELYETIK
jgi:hypothetical protein